MDEIYLGVVTHWAFWVVLIGCGAFYGIQKQFEVPKLKALHLRPFDALRDHYVVVVFAVGGLVLAGAYRMYLRDIMWSVHAMVGRLRALADAPTGDDFAETLNNLAQGSALLLGALAAAATLIFTLLRTWINERTTRATEEGLITDRINATVASLGADKTVKGFKDGTEYTRPNIEVRVGAILALERIAKRSPDVHCQIMEILCSFIRENTKGIEDDPINRMAIFAKNYKIPNEPWETRPDLHVFQYNQANHELPALPKPPREDIQLVLTVIGRRSEKAIAMEPWELIDLRGAYLVRADLRGARLPNAQLNGAQLNGANLSEAQLNGADLRDAKLNKAKLNLAHVNGAQLDGAQLNEADLVKAQLNKAHLIRAQLNKAKLHYAHLNRAVLTKAEFNWASLYKTQLNEADLTGARLNGSIGLQFAELRGAWAKQLDFTDVTITREKLHEMFGDASVILPEALQPAPAHWPTVDLFWRDARDEQNRWLEDPDGYVFDPTRYGDRYTDQTGE